jgi:hypothetical protein
MSELLNKLNEGDYELKEDFKNIIGISVGMFLFILFFQPLAGTIVIIKSADNYIEIFYFDNNNLKKNFYVPL